MSDFRLLLDEPQTVEWETPAKIFADLHAEFNFTLDPCATASNAKCGRFFTAEDNGLSRSWAGERVFMNPPYGRAIGLWMWKAYRESQGGALVVCLVFARTDTRWWHDYAMTGEVRFLRGRLHFKRADGKTGPSPCGSAVVVMRPRSP